MPHTIKVLHQIFSIPQFFWENLIKDLRSWFPKEEIDRKRGELAWLIRKMSDEQHPANLITFPSLPFTAPPARTRRRAQSDEELAVVEAECRTGPSLSASQFCGAGRTLRSGSSTAAAREERHRSREQQLQQSVSARSTAREERHRSREQQLQSGQARSSRLKAEIGKSVGRAKVNLTNSFLVLSLFHLLQLWANCSVS